MGVGATIAKAFFGSQHEKDIKAMIPIVTKINNLEDSMQQLSESEFREKTQSFKEQLQKGATLADILPEAFALAREAAKRILGERAYDVQLMGAISLNKGRIVEMKTGEGKTLSSVPAAYLNALEGKGVHVVTVNDYLAQRDANWMRPVFSLLGLSVGTILPEMDNEARQKAYNCDITYGTNNEFGFDYLRDNMKLYKEEKVQRPFNYCIIDEIDSILIDEARTPLIISGQADDDTGKFVQANSLCGRLTECKKDPATGEYPLEENELDGDFKLEEKNKSIKFTNSGMNKIEEILKSSRIIDGSLFDSNNFEYVHYFTQALRARLLFKKDVDYIVQDGKVEIVDEFTGRVLTGRRYSDGLHQAIEAKENIKVAHRNRTLATITFQNFFRMYKKISGMTGTADTEAKEFAKIYNLDVTVIPTNKPIARVDEQDLIYLDQNIKYKAICDEIAKIHATGQPILVGTVSIEKSELLSNMLRKRAIPHEVLNAKNHSREALIIAEAGSKGAVTIATNMAGRGTDIKLGGSPDFRARKIVGQDATPQEYLVAYEKEVTKWQKDYKEIKELGGLYIIGTERHESRRIDNQLRGRSGRQGDPGRSRFFLSLDDDLMRLFGGENLKNMMGRLGMNNGEPIYHKFISNAIEKAQSRVEDRNFEIRKHLLEYDDVLNAQRNFIYTQRDELLEDEQIIARVKDTIEDIVIDTIDEFKDKGKNGYTDFMDQLKKDFYTLPDISLDTFLKSDEGQLTKQICEFYNSSLDEKIALVGNEIFNQFLRFEYLYQVDRRWQDHLEEMEELREGVYLRSYGQKNPLQEYKREGSDIFHQLIYQIRCDIAKKAVKVRVQENPQQRRQVPTHIQSSHNSMGFGGQRANQPIGDQKIQIRRSSQKVGRNDPCPCGSGKKYKQCCGRNE